MAALKRESGSKLPHSTWSFLQSQLYATVKKSQGKSFAGKEQRNRQRDLGRENPGRGSLPATRRVSMADSSCSLCVRTELHRLQTAADSPLSRSTCRKRLSGW